MTTQPLRLSSCVYPWQSDLVEAAFLQVAETQPLVCCFPSLSVIGNNNV